MSEEKTFPSQQKIPHLAAGDFLLLTYKTSSQINRTYQQ
jgi:hypothetical protein